MSLTKRQLEMRRLGVSASEIAVLAGLSKWTSPIEIWQRKMGRAKDLDSYAVDLGTEFEEPLARVYAKRNKVVLARVDTLQHPTKPYALATPDRAVYLSKEAAGDLRRVKLDVRDAQKLLEVKSSSWRMRRFWGEPGTDSIPDEYLLQVIWQMAVTGVPTCDVFVDFDKTEGLVFPVVYRESTFEMLYEIAEKFMVDHVLPGRPTPPDWTDQYSDFLKEEFPREANRKADLQVVTAETHPGVWKALQLSAMCSAADKRLEKMSKYARNLLAAELGTGSGFTGSFGKVTYLANKDSSKVDWEAVANETAYIAGIAIESIPEAEGKRVLGDELRKVIPKHTTVKPGARVLRKTWVGEFAHDVELLEVKLERLTKGLEVEEISPDAGVDVSGDQ